MEPRPTRRDVVWSLAGMAALTTTVPLLAACERGGGGDVQVKPSGREVTLTHMFNWAPAYYYSATVNLMGSC